MKVSKKSWHYRWMNRIGFSHPDNLCAYFWKTVWSGLVFPVAAVAAMLGVVLLTIPFWAWFFPDILDIQVLAMLVGVMEIIGLSIALYIQVTDRWQKEKWLAQDDGTWVARKPGLLAAWLKARHDQVCPYLDFTND